MPSLAEQGRPIDTQVPSKDPKADAYARFFTYLPDIYQQHDINVLGNEIPFLDERGRLNGRVHELSERFMYANYSVSRAAREIFGHTSPEGLSSGMIAELTPWVNTLFQENLMTNQRPHTQQPTWMSSSGEVIAGIQAIVRRFDQDPRYRTYLKEDAPEMAEILRIFAFDLPKVRDWDRSKKFAKIDELSFALHRRGLPVVIAPRTFYYSESYLKDERLAKRARLIPEATIRLMFPSNPYERAEIAGLNGLLWPKLLQLHPNERFMLMPHMIIGQWVMAAGSDIPSVTYAELLEGRHFMVCKNLYKNFRVIEKAAAVAHIASTEEDLMRAFTYVLSWHENGHLFYNLNDQSVEELDTDLTMFWGALTYARSHGLPRQHVVCALLGEYAGFAIQQVTSSVLTDAYRTSGIYVFNSLVRQGIIRLEGDQIVITVKPVDRGIVDDHNAIYNEVPGVAERLKAQELLPEARAIAQIILAGR